MFSLLSDFHWTNLLQPQWYINNGGLLLLLFVVFAETGLFAGFFLPGDSLLFVAGIYSNDLIGWIYDTNNDVLNLVLLIILVSLAGIAGNIVGYWFGKKGGTTLYRRPDTFLFKKKYLLQAKRFYENNGGFTIIVARFVPFVRTFAPIVAGIIEMDYKKFMWYNIVGCIAWSISMISAGHYLNKFFLAKYNFDLTQHLEIIVLGIVAVSTIPIIIKLVTSKISNQNEGK